MTAPSSTDRRAALDRVRERRNALRLALQTLEDANAAPAGASWRARVTAALDQAAAMLAEHVAETEGPEGFFHDLVQDEPRIGQQVDRLRDDHVALQRQLAHLIDRCRAGTCPPAEVRQEVLALIGLLHQHRHAGADLLYEAYEVDVATAD